MVYCGGLIRTLKCYGAGPNMYKLLKNFWSHQDVVIRQNCYYGPNFTSNQGTIQGGLITPTLFNVVVDNVVWTWLEITAEYQAVAQEGLDLNVGRCLGVFYAYKIMIGE